MLKKVLLGGALLAQAAIPALAQRRCGTPAVQDLPAAERATLDRIESFTARYAKSRAELSEGQTANRTAAIVTIPVVVHILYNTSAQNISDAIVQSQITVLNNDFAKTNANFSSTPSAFQGVAADMEVRFALATRTPTGAATNGIIHKYTPNSFFEYGRKDAQGVFVKQSAKGGDDAWDTSKYLNVWVCNFGGSAASLLGYATFPSDAGTYKDGVVMGYKYFGVNPALGGIYGYGRTATHEVGHWLNLRHIWGDGSCATDFVADTPTQQTSNYNCPTFPRRTCGNTTSGDMFVNYMDYTADQCMTMFTAGQKTRSQALFATGGARASILTSGGLSRPAGGGVTTIEPAALRALSVYPNPVAGAATVRVELRQALANATVRVLDGQGRPVFEQTLSALPAGLTELPLPTLRQGLYTVQLTGSGLAERLRLAVTAAAE